MQAAWLLCNSKATCISYFSVAVLKNERGFIVLQFQRERREPIMIGETQQQAAGKPYLQLQILTKE